MRIGARLSPALGALAVACVSACGDRGGEPPAPTGVPAEPVAVPTRSSDPAGEAGGGAATALPMPSPYRARGPRAVAQNAACEACHADEAAAWRSSHHRHAYTDRAFQDALAVEPSPFCKGCHAPEAADPSRPTEEEAALGVGCVSCHVTEGDLVLAASKDGVDRVESTRAHDVARSAEFAHTGACAGCHEFRFPFTRAEGDAAFMQTTVAEHARSPARDQPCASCHMPSRGGRRAHGFEQVRDPAWLREGLSATAELTPEGRVRVSVAQTRPGHAFPTGDLFRRLQVGAALETPRGAEVSRDERFLARHLHLVPGGKGRELVADDRIFFEPVVLELDPGTAPGHRIRWWISLDRVAQALEGPEPRRAVVESSVELFSETLSSPARSSVP